MSLYISLGFTILSLPFSKTSSTITHASGVVKFWLKKSENFPVLYVCFRCKICKVVHNGQFYIHIHNVCIYLEFDSLWKCSFSGTIHNFILGIFNVLYFKPIHQFWELWCISIWGKVPFWISLLNAKSLGHLANQYM